MARKQEISSGDCERCGHHFDLSDTIYIIPFGMERRDICIPCREEVLTEIDEHPKQLTA